MSVIQSITHMHLASESFAYFGSFENFGGHPAMKKSSGGTGSKWELPNQGIETRLNAYGPLYVKKPPKYWSNPMF